MYVVSEDLSIQYKQNIIPTVFTKPTNCTTHYTYLTITCTSEV